jgi:hypothetical protein
MNKLTPIREFEQAVYVYWYGPKLPTVKIGHTNDPAKRLIQLGNDTGVPDHLASFAAIVWVDRKREKVEARAHELAANFRKTGEWFELTASDALRYIVSAAEELNVRYEIEDRAGIDEKKSPNQLMEESRGLEKWGANWRGMDSAEELAEEKLDAAKDALQDARKALALAEEEHQIHLATNAVFEAESALKVALHSLEAVHQNATPAYKSRILKWQKMISEREAKEAYWKAHPEEWARQQYADAQAAEQKRLDGIRLQAEQAERDIALATNAKKRDELQAEYRKLHPEEWAAKIAKMDAENAAATALTLKRKWAGLQ